MGRRVGTGDTVSPQLTRFRTHVPNVFGDTLPATTVRQLDEGGVRVGRSGGHGGGVAAVKGSTSFRSVPHVPGGSYLGMESTVFAVLFVGTISTLLRNQRGGTIITHYTISHSKQRKLLGDGVIHVEMG